MKLCHDDHDGSTGGHDHIHTHETHSHTHDHSHKEDILFSDKEMQTLYALLDHWVEHNLSHQEGFNEWAEKASGSGKTETSDAILKAVHFMEEANEMLKLAKQKMK